MGTKDQDVEQVEINIEQAKAMIDNMKALERLTANKDFNNLIIEGYFKEEASRLVLLRADPSFSAPNMQADLLKAIDAIGQFKLYCNTIMGMGRTAERSLEADEQTLEELLAEAV